MLGRRGRAERGSGWDARDLRRRWPARRPRSAMSVASTLSTMRCSLQRLTTRGEPRARGTDMHRIESRLLPAPVDDARLARLVELTRRIADAIGRGDHGLAPLLEEWNASAHRRYAEVDFTALHGAVDAEAFASEALSRPAGYLADLRFEETSAAMGAVAGAKLSEAQTATALRGLENNFPGAEVSDLLARPVVRGRVSSARRAQPRSARRLRVRPVGACAHGCPRGPPVALPRPSGASRHPAVARGWVGLTRVATRPRGRRDMRRPRPLSRPTRRTRRGFRGSR